MRKVLFALLLAMLCFGCSNATTKAGSETRPAAVATVPKLNSVSDKALPMQAYYVSDDQLKQLQRAVDKLRKQCMAGYGLDYEGVPPQSRPGSENRMTLRYLLADADVAAANGYHAAPSAGTGMKPERPNLTPDQTLVLLGPSRGNEKPGTSKTAGEYNGKTVPPGGCFRTANETLLDSAAHPLGGDDPLVDKLDDQAYTSMLKDTRVLAVWQKWSGCMKAQGYDYATPADAGRDPQWTTSGSSASTKERATAIADVACKHKYNVVGTQFTVESAYAKPLIEQNAEALADIKELNDKRLRLAAGVVSGAPS